MDGGDSQAARAYRALPYHMRRRLSQAELKERDWKILYRVVPCPWGENL